MSRIEGGPGTVPRAAVMSKELIAGAMASPPEVYLRLCELLNDPRATSEDMARVISTDPALTARLLKLVNSSFYRVPAPVETVSRAVTVIGMLQLVQLTLATGVIKAFAGISTMLIDMDAYWRHSIYVGVVARILAKRAGIDDPELLFTAGILHDIGILIICHGVPDLAREALQRSQRENLPLYMAEHEIMGFDHGNVGGDLARAWQLSPRLEEAMEYHHRLDDMRPRRLCKEAAIVHLADVIASITGKSETGTGLVSQPYHGAWAMAGLPIIMRLEEVIESADVQFAEALDMFDLT